ncbi:MAG: universal stress protein [Hyphomicrobiales bacterium]
MAKKILVPVDLGDTETSGKVLAQAVDQAQHDGAELMVLTVVPNMITGIDYRYAIRGEMGGSEEYDLKEIVKNALDHLNQFVADNTPKGMKAETIARHGTIYEQILDVADEAGVDQIVIGAHRPQLADYLLGPNTSRVVRHAKCSVNVVRL